MTAYTDVVRQSFEPLESNHLIDKVRGGQLTDQAHAIALAVLQERGVSIQGLPDSPDPDGPGESWDKPSPGELLEHAQRRRMALSLLGISLLPIWCGLVGVVSVEGLGGKDILARLGALALLLCLLPPAFYAVWRFAFHWGELPMKPKQRRTLVQLGVLLAIPSFWLGAVALYAVLRSLLA
jgi:hypothetical protein